MAKPMGDTQMKLTNLLTGAAVAALLTGAANAQLVSGDNDTNANNDDAFSYNNN